MTMTGSKAHRTIHFKGMIDLHIVTKVLQVGGGGRKRPRNSRKSQWVKEAGTGRIASYDTEACRQWLVLADLHH